MNGITPEKLYDTITELMVESGDFEDVIIKNLVVIADVESLKAEKDGSILQKVWFASAAIDGRTAPPWTVAGLLEWVKDVVLNGQDESDLEDYD
jgi:hypothetical protein